MAPSNQRVPGIAVDTDARSAGVAHTVSHHSATDEYAEWPQRWPDLADSPLMHDENGEPVTHAVYCRRMDGRLRDHAEAGMSRLSVVPVRSAEFLPWVAEYAQDKQDPSQLRAQYAADVAQDPSRTVAWPPGRNEPCWCGSGRKYKKCCGAPGAPL